MGSTSQILHYPLAITFSYFYCPASTKPFSLISMKYNSRASFCMRWQ
jgi:hypothetical protein